MEVLVIIHLVLTAHTVTTIPIIVPDLVFLLILEFGIALILEFVIGIGPIMVLTVIIIIILLPIIIITRLPIMGQLLILRIVAPNKLITFFILNWMYPF